MRRMTANPAAQRQTGNAGPQTGLSSDTSCGAGSVCVMPNRMMVGMKP